MNLGILGTSDIAYRRFLPALMKTEYFNYIGVASRDLEKTKAFQDKFGGQGYAGYDALLQDPQIEAVYIPLPPALHFQWAQKALEKGKHVLLEKPFTTNIADTKALIDLAQKKGLAVHENYMFVYHSQLQKIKEIIAQGDLGELRLIRSSFGFPFRGKDDFRYDKKMGGGALLDCGGYPVKLASILLGQDVKVTAAKLNDSLNFDVDLYGSATLENEQGLTAQIAFGMDNSYKCDLEVWGSKGYLKADRIFTAPEDFKPTMFVQTSKGLETTILAEDDQFAKSIMRFEQCIKEPSVKELNYQDILKQECLMTEIIQLAY